MRDCMTESKLADLQQCGYSGKANALEIVHFDRVSHLVQVDVKFLRFLQQNPKSF